MRVRSSAFLSGVIATLLRALAATWRLQIKDNAGLLDPTPEAKRSVIWVLWHNRILVIPILYERFFRHRPGAVLISRSRDGGILADCIQRFGGEPVRGSSSRGGASALRQLQKRVLEGTDAYITPDGPKGPRYSVGPGAVWLAQATGAALMPVAIECSSCWRLGRWDGFIIPKPFARVTVTLQSPYFVASSRDDNSEPEQENLRTVMMRQTELH